MDWAMRDSVGAKNAKKMMIFVYLLYYYFLLLLLENTRGILKFSWFISV